MVEVVVHGAGAAAAHRDDVEGVWAAAFGPIIDIESWRETVWERHRTRSGFRLATAHAAGELVGFGWGYTGEPGQFWSDLVLDRLGSAAAGWVGGHFELAELAVVPQARRRGTGGRLHDALLSGLPHSRALLGTEDDPTTPAVRLYVSRGWRRLGSQSPTDQVMGKLLEPEPTDGPPDEATIAAALTAARWAGRSLPGFPGTVPTDMAAAYRIQDAAIARWPDQLAGWKIGFIPADRRQPREPDRLIGPIWNRQCHPGGPALVEMGVFASGFAAVEAELVVRLMEDVPAGRDDWNADEAAELAQDLILGIEVASSPIPDINALGPSVIAADFGNNNGLVLGPALAYGPDAFPLRIACRVDGRLVGEGSNTNLPGGMHHGLATALNLLARRGQPVQAGMAFATGAITGIHPIAPGQHCQVSLSGGGSVELRAVDASIQPTLPRRNP